MPESPPARRKTRKREPEAGPLPQADGIGLDAPPMSVAGTVLMNAKRLLDAQEHHVDQLWQQLAVVLNDDALPARERFDLVVKSCFDAEATPVEGSALLEARRTLHDEGFERFLQSVTQELEAFLRDALPARRDECHFLACFCLTVITGALDRLETKPLPQPETLRFANEMAEMLATHLRL